MSRRAAMAALFGVTAGILVLTLTPTGSAGGVESFSVPLRIQGFRGLADSLANILLFAPFGAAVAMLRPGWFRPILAGAALSLAVELMQLIVPGRYTSPWDVIFNTAGASVGVAIVRHATSWLRPPPATAAALAGLALTGALGVLLAGPLLFTPATLPDTLVGQWTHVYEGAPRYDGRILEARVGDVPVHAWPVEQSRQLRAALFRDTVFLRVRAGPPPDGAAPLFAIAAPDEQALFNLAVRQHDVILSYRMHARRVGLDQPDVRAPGILDGIAPGDTFTLRTWREGAGNCLEIRPASAVANPGAPGGGTEVTVAGGAADPTAGGRIFCHAGFTAADTWTLLLYPVPRPIAVLLPLLWAAALLVPAGFWSRSPVVLAVSVLAILVAAGLGNAVLSWAAGPTMARASANASVLLPPPIPPLVVLSALAGLAAGRFAASRIAHSGPGATASARARDGVLQQPPGRM